MALDKVRLSAQLVGIQVRRIGELGALVELGVTEERDALAELAGDEDEGIENYADESHELETLAALYARFAAVALYGVVEIRTKAALGWRAPAREVKAAYKFDQQQALFKKYAGRTLASLTHFRSIDELRCLNNCVKHSGIVDGELARFPGWKKGADLGDVRRAVERLEPSVEPHLLEVLQALG